MARDTFEEDTYYYVPMYERISHCSPAADGECACPADECIRPREG